MLAACAGEQNYAEGLTQPATDGPTVGPGSGDLIAAHLHYTLQRNNPQTKYDDPSCPDVESSEPGTEVTCEMHVGEGRDKETFTLRLDDDGLWQISDGPTD
jgi:hypothetical protein